MTRTVSVLLPIPAEGAYSYAVPQDMQLAPGDHVQVPLGPRKVAAVVWDGEAGGVEPRKLRPVEAKFDCPPLSAELRRFVDWAARYTVSPPGMVLRMVLRAPGGLEPPRPETGYRFTGNVPDRMTDARRRIIELVGDGIAWSKSGLAHAAGTSASVVDGLIRLNVLEPVDLPLRPLVPPPDPQGHAPEFEPDQRGAASQLTDAAAGGFSVTLLDGVTGSGKTEVYFEAVAKALETGRQVLILLPEIALTASFLERFEKRFGARPGEWHSDVAPKRRELLWRQVATGEVRVIAGARSALFLPFADLGLIIVDEEHDQAYKQEDRVFYHARDMAVVRGQLADCPVVLASATPSVESLVNARRGRYRHLRLERRFGDAVLPEIATIDMRKTPPPRGGFIAPPLRQALAETLASGQQSLLFLNRRGYAPLTLCRVCGHRFQCPNCTTWLVEHRFRGQLQCHHCGHSEPAPQACPECGTFDHLAACGPGVERLAEEAVTLFPDARILVLSSDLMGGVRRLRLELEAIANGECDIVIGTQLVAKGHHFPLMRCVGVVDADLGLSNGDPRAAERTFQLLSQVTGRAGRIGGRSVGYLQTYQPDHPVIAAIAAGDREAFYDREIAGREAAGLPPFGRLASIIVSAATRREAESHARALRRAAPPAGGITLLGPAEAPIAILRERHRFRLLVHAGLKAGLQDFLTAWLAHGPKEQGSIRVQIDIDPQSFL
ncbi:MAG: primosomal protein N' [Nitratireductor sp.]|nr:primosomal protein N' [Nitratireductor sp.]